MSKELSGAAGDDRTESPVDRVSAGVRAAGRRAGTAAFGDRLGLVLFLATLTVVAATWRVGFFLTDSYAVANALANVADGSLAIRRLPYSLTLGSQPGLVVVDGALYGRNYAQVFASVPVLWLLEAGAAVTDLAVLLVAGWCLLVLALFDQVGRVVGRHRQFAAAGVAVALVAFVLDLAVVRPLSTRWLPVVALQITTMLAAAFVAVALYRLVASFHGCRVGALTGGATVLGTSVGFWATIPKRHAFTALAVVVVLAAVARSRGVADVRRTLRARALAYATVALLAWLHAPEALVVLAALVPVDLVTAQSNRPRVLVVLGVVFLVALTPFLATNYAISGNPIEPPRTLPSYDDDADLENPPGNLRAATDRDAAVVTQATAVDTGGGDGTPPGTAADGTGTGDNGGTDSGDGDTAGDGGGETRDGGGAGTDAVTRTAGGTATGSPAGSAGDGGALAAVVGLIAAALSRAVAALGTASDLLVGGARTAVEEPDRLYHTFLRSGRVPEYVKYKINDQEAIELTLLETAPLLGGLSGAVAAVVGLVRGGFPDRGVRRAISRPERATDLFAVVLALLFVLIYLERLPVYSQITVRYLLPLVALGCYGLARLRPVRRAVRTRPLWLAVAYPAILAFGGGALVAANAILGLALGEAVQLHALLGLVTASVLVIWSLVGRLEPIADRADGRVGAVALAAAAGVGTLFVALSAVGYFEYGSYALPITRVVAEWLPVAG